MTRFRKQFTKPVMVWLILFIFKFTSVEAADYEYHLRGNASDFRPQATEGALLLAGGGGRVDDSYRWFFKKAGGGDIVILSATLGDSSADYWFNTIGGCDSVQTIVFLSREAASDKKLLEIIKNAEGIFIGGGAQWKYVDYWKGTPVGQLLDEHVRAGKPLGGSSAGLAVLGDTCYTAHVSARLTSQMAMTNPFDDRITLDDDFLHFDFMRGIITDTHFTPRNRLGRLISFLGRIRTTQGSEDFVGLGVDERTALCLESNGKGRVMSSDANGLAWLVTPTKPPETIQSGKPLTFCNIRVIGAGPQSTIDLPKRLIENSVVTKSVSVVEGELSIVESRPDKLTSQSSVIDTRGIHDGQEKEWKEIARFFETPPEFAGQYGNYRSPMQFNDGRRVTSTDQWQTRRTEILQYWEEKLGKWPELITKPNLEILETSRRENFQQLKVRFMWMPGETTTGYLLVPDGEGPRPSVITVYYEPETAIGQGKPDRDFALQLARRGFICLSIGTSDASANKSYSLYYPSIDKAQIEPLSMLGYAAANAWHALASRPEVDSTRIGIIGHSFGGKWAMFGSCLFDKFACAVWSDPGIVFDDDRPSVNYWEPWYLGYHPKPWRMRGLVTQDNPARGAYPILRQEGRDLHELHALMAPRPFLVSGGAEDPPERWIPLNHSIAVNRLLGHNDRVGMTNRKEHAPNEESNAQIYTFFEHVLKK